MVQRLHPQVQGPWEHRGRRASARLVRLVRLRQRVRELRAWEQQRRVQKEPMAHQELVAWRLRVLLVRSVHWELQALEQRERPQRREPAAWELQQQRVLREQEVSVLQLRRQQVHPGQRVSAQREHRQQWARREVWELRQQARQVSQERRELAAWERQLREQERPE